MAPVIRIIAEFVPIRARIKINDPREATYIIISGGSSENPAPAKPARRPLEAAIPGWMAARWGLPRNSGASNLLLRERCNFRWHLMIF